MKKLLIYMMICCSTGECYGLGKDIDVGKIMVENNLILNGMKQLNNEITKGKTVWVEGKSLKECMKKEKALNNNAINCHRGYYKEVK